MKTLKSLKISQQQQLMQIVLSEHKLSPRRLNKSPETS